MIYFLESQTLNSYSLPKNVDLVMEAMLIFFVLLLLSAWRPSQAHTSFTFNGFHGSSDLNLIGASSIYSTAISITNQSRYVSGRALYKKPVRLKDAGSFSTTFVFSMGYRDGKKLGTGFAFLITPHNSTDGAFARQYLGLLNLSSLGKSYNHLFAVEFATLQSLEFQDVSNNHVGVDINNLVSVTGKPAGYWAGNEFRDLKLNNGKNIQAWIDYDHVQNQLDVAIVRAGSPRPRKPLISLKNFSLSTIFEEEMYVGFSSATGKVWVEEHYILAWSFSTNGTAPVLDVSRLPCLIKSKRRRKRIAFGAVMAVLISIIIAGGIMGWRWRRRRRRSREDIEDWELEYWPHRFKYKDLYTATKGFRENQIVGYGRFGRVYRGVLPNGREVAVKCIFRHSGQAMREFIAEISSLGRLQHRNLVQIRGYCRRGKQLFIIYDYMSNGNLEGMIFGDPVLPWSRRYRILRDVAAGLLYLHEQWEQRVVHRDIKSSNVLVDAEFNGRLSDFGLARSYKHSENPRTTQVVGTLGYIAPELLHTGQASPETDVYSFGILMLEVATGREPVNVNASRNGDPKVLVEWVRNLSESGRIMDAADPKLGGDFVPSEMERVLKLGVLCSNRLAEARLVMRVVVKMLEGKASLPSVLPSVSTGTRIPGMKS